jgi:hypothetical protein
VKSRREVRLRYFISMYEIEYWNPFKLF